MLAFYLCWKTLKKSFDITSKKYKLSLYFTFIFSYMTTITWKDLVEAFKKYEKANRVWTRHYENEEISWVELIEALADMAEVRETFEWARNEEMRNMKWGNTKLFDNEE